jgi:hypothetical protein
MKIVFLPGSKKPVAVIGGFRCPNCHRFLKRVQQTPFGYDVVCPKGDYVAGVMI